MTLDEAIAHARDVASEQRMRSGVCTQNGTECDKFSACLQCAEEHEQLAEWMEELKTYREVGTVVECRAAVEKQKAISREIIEGKYFCPKCHNLMPYPGYCGCGQRLYYWSDEE